MLIVAVMPVVIVITSVTLVMRDAHGDRAGGGIARGVRALNLDRIAARAVVIAVRRQENR